MKSEFYDLLSNDQEFCFTLGKVILVASKLEILLKKYLRINGSDVPEKKATLGNLIGLLKKNGHLTRNGKIHFNQANLQRNYLIHNLYASFVDEIEKKLLPVDDLIPLDVEIYTEKILETLEAFEAYIEMIEKAISEHELAELDDVKPNILL